MRGRLEEPVIDVIFVTWVSVSDVCGGLSVLKKKQMYLILKSGVRKYYLPCDFMSILRWRGVLKREEHLRHFEFFFF